MSDRDELTAAIDEAFDADELTTTEQPKPSVRQPQTEDEFDAEFDAALERHEERNRIRDGVEKPEDPEPERDYSKVVAAATDLGVSLTNVATPDKFADIDLQDEGAVRERLIELQEREDQAEYLRDLSEVVRQNEQEAELVAEQVMEDARVILEEGDASQLWQAANIIQERHPEQFDQFMAEWTEYDPEGAGVWARTHPPIDWEARKAQAAWQFEEAQQAVEQKAAAEHSRAIEEAFNTREQELLADPKTAPYVEGALNLLAAQLEAGQEIGVSSPEEVERLLDATVKTVRSARGALHEAHAEARDLLEIDRRAHIHRLANGETDGSWDEAEALERLTDERFFERGGIPGPPPTAQEDEDAFLASFNRVLDEKDRVSRAHAEMAQADGEFIKEQEARRNPWLRGR